MTEDQNVQNQELSRMEQESSWAFFETKKYIAQNHGPASKEHKPTNPNLWILTTLICTWCSIAKERYTEN